MSAKICDPYLPVYPDFYEIQRDKEEDEDLNGRKQIFYPSLSSQRYEYVTKELLRHEDTIDKLVDFGCNEGKLLMRAKRRLHRSMTMIGVDMDEEALNVAQKNLEPTVDDIINKLECPLRMKLFCGSVAEYDSRLFDTDAVVAIELIEHLNYHTLQKFPEIVFGKLQPFIVIITTPNVEYNVIFDMAGRRFRHDDHKFEWTRKEFEKWCLKITTKYKNYWVKFTGVGDPPPTYNVGYCTQIAVFRRKRSEYLPFRVSRRENRRLDLEQFGDVGYNPVKRYLETDRSICQPYKLITDISYPVKSSEHRNNRILNELHSFCEDLISFQNKPSEYHLGAKGVWFTFDELMKCTYVKRCLKTVEELLLFVIDQEWMVDLRGEKAFFEQEPPPNHENNVSSEEYDDFNELDISSAGSVQSFGSSSGSGSPGSAE